jgi:hypothetical protein
VPIKLVPVITTVVAPAVDPKDGVNEVIVGTLASKTKTSLALAMPPGVTTSTVTGPEARAGVVAVICVDELIVKFVALVPPKRTAVAPVKFVPAITTTVPPEVVPELGLNVEAVGKAL